MKRILLCLSVFVLLAAINASARTVIPMVRFQEGFARITGTVSCDKPANGLSLIVVVKDPFKDQPDFYSATVQTDGTFSLKLPLTTNNAFASMLFKDDSTNYAPGSLLGLSQTKAIRINAIIRDGHISIKTSGGIDLSEEDRFGYPEAIFNFDTAQGQLSGVARTYYKLPLKDYVSLQMDSVLTRRIDYALKDISLSPELRSLLVNALRIHFVGGRMFSYKADARRRFNLNVQEPPLSYYS